MKNTKARSCTSKKRYESRDEAWSVSNALFKTTGGRYRHYRCTFCKGWHLTSRSHSNARRRRAWR